MNLITESKLRSMLKRGIPNPFIIREDDKLTPAAVDFLRDRRITIKNQRLLKSVLPPNEHQTSFMIPAGVSNRHIHLAPEDVEILFGSGFSLTPYRELSQPGQFSANEQITLMGPKGVIQNVRILGPARGETQVEISITDGFQLGIHPPVRLSGSLEGTPGLTLIGPKGCISLQKGVIVAKRHVHMSVEDADRHHLQQGDQLIIQTLGDRPIIFTDVVVRVNPNYRLDFHVDLDEGNAASLKTGDQVKIVGKNGMFFPVTGGE
ncbi:phosphate propanoyltransferase [Bacillus sp. X1(2014)]|uniref:phosphate propanoyltransferase n=1 Tax=Bacillus sp. X1(2014) TaxID=1565991 RepID=UPI0011A274AE|nr:phosphate propanoyltransferase [Bacillus sp. X1(2014)]